MRHLFSRACQNNQGNKHDLEMNRNTNERANENVKENSFDEDTSANDVGSEITDGEAG
jgi:hypothetical protein